MKAIIGQEAKCCRRLDEIIVEAVKHLEILGHRRRTIENYRYVWKKFLQFTLKKSKERMFSTNLAYQFLESCGICSDKVETGMTFRQRHIRNVMNALTEFGLHGCIASKVR